MKRNIHPLKNLPAASKAGLGQHYFTAGAVTFFLKSNAILLLFLLIQITPSGFAQSIKLGTGTAVNTTTAASPVNIYYRQSVSQTVYTVAELNAAGITGPAVINKLGYFVTQVPLYNIPGYQISMKHTTASNANTNLEGGYTIVKNAFNYAPVAGNWDIIKLDQPFSWNGTQNIVVRLCWSQVQPAYNASGQCRVYSTANGYKHRSSDNSGSSCSLVPNTTTTNKPQIHFIFDTVTVWTGASSSSWNTASNWTKGVPNTYMDAKIPVVSTHSPTISTTATCDELILNGSMTLATTGVLNIQSHFTSSGTFIDNGGIVAMQGTKASHISGNLSIHYLQIENQVGTSVTSGAITIIKELRVKQSTFHTNNAVTLKSDANGTARIDELKSTCTYSLNMADTYGDSWNGGYITVLSDSVSVGTFNGDGYGSVESFEVSSGSLLEVKYTAGTWENENSFSLLSPTNSVMYSSGPPITAGTVYTTVASCSFSPMIVGSVSTQRYIDAGETYWRYFSSAVENPTISQYLDDFVTSGFTGSPFPSFAFTSIYTYDETMGSGEGYVPCSGTSQIIAPGQGLEVWSGDSLEGTAPFTVDLSGQPNQGPINMPVTYTNTGTVDEDGWNLVGNPYASTINWNSPKWTKYNVADAVYILNPDTKQYATYVNGASTNGGSPYIASQQAFWVYATGPMPALITNEGIKVPNDQPFFKSAGELTQGAIIRIQQNELKDEAVIRDVTDATDAYEKHYDAKKMWGGWGETPQLSFVNQVETDLSVHSFDFGLQEWSVPVRAVVFQSGVYNLVFENIAALEVPCLKLEDLYTGISYDIVEGTSIPFELSDTSWSPRFILHVGRRFPIKTENAFCHDSEDGSFELQLNDSTLLPFILTSDSGTLSDSAIRFPFLIGHLSAGDYVIQLPGITNICGSDTFHFTIEHPALLQVNSEIVHDTIAGQPYTGISPYGGTPPYSYSWSTGDTTQLVADLSPGDFTIVVTDHNGCSWEGGFTLLDYTGMEEQQTPETCAVTYNAQTNQLLITGLVTVSGPFNLYNIQGEMITSWYVQQGEQNRVIDLPVDLAAGVYVFAGVNQNSMVKLVKN